MTDARPPVMISALTSRWYKRIFDVLASVKFAVGLVVIIALVCVAGTVLPRGAYIFKAWWFIGLLGLLALTVTTCSMRRIVTVHRANGFARGRAVGSLLTHLSILLILAGAVVRGIWGESGYIELREGETKNEFLIENRAKPLPFAVHLEDFHIQRYGESARPAATHEDHQLLVQWPARRLSARVPVNLNVRHSLTPQGEEESADNTFYIRVLRYVPDFAMDSETREVVSRSKEPNNPAVLVEVKGAEYENNCWLFAKHADFKLYGEGHEPAMPSPLRLFYQFAVHNARAATVNTPVKSFKSAVRIIENGTPRTGVIEVNRPFTHAGYTFYQTGYDPNDLSWTSLQVVRDPGVPLVYAGFAVLLAGLFTVFYLNPWLHARKTAKAPVLLSHERAAA